ncbi:unnamed protein product [Closterium sp. NIES-54]
MPLKGTFQSPGSLYQQEVLQVALERNTIVYLETGMGKTLVAVMLMQVIMALIHDCLITCMVIDGQAWGRLLLSCLCSITLSSHWELLGHSSMVVLLTAECLTTLFLPHALMQARRQMRERSGKICVFLVPAVALVIQVLVMTSQVLVNLLHHAFLSLSSQSFRHPPSPLQVLVMTPQVLVNLLQHAFLCLSSVDLLIFDECHHTAKDHAYATIMKTWYFSLKQADRPLIFGMTASPINTKGSGSEESCVQQLLEFERILDSKVCGRLD